MSSSNDKTGQPSTVMCSWVDGTQPFTSLKDNRSNTEKNWIDLDPPLDCIKQTKPTSETLKNRVPTKPIGYPCAPKPSSLTSGLSTSSESFGSQELIETGD
eukprot:2525339-Ditylum_brightwellii.AAC.1